MNSPRSLRLSKLIVAGVLAALSAFSGRSDAAPNELGFVAPERKREAKARYDEGVNAYRAGHYGQAASLFLEADGLAPSPALSFNVARAYDRLGDVAKALRFYRDYLRRDSAAVNADDVRLRAHELETHLASLGVQQLTVSSDPPAFELIIDGREVGVTPWTGELSPGKHRVELVRMGLVRAAEDIELPVSHAIDVIIRLRAFQAPAPMLAWNARQSHGFEGYASNPRR